MQCMYVHMLVTHAIAFIVSKSSPGDETRMNPNPTYEMMNPDLPKEPTSHGDYENVEQPRPVSMTSNPAYTIP